MEQERLASSPLNPPAIPSDPPAPSPMPALPLPPLLRPVGSCHRATLHFSSAPVTANSCTGHTAVRTGISVACASAR
uniref:Uncharacterized protein n=1 Tax=Oryza punctata TaxID=4537 RepID=A0A0E0K9Y6_ORYPU